MLKTNSNRLDGKTQVEDERAQAVQLIAAIRERYLAAGTAEVTNEEEEEELA